MQPVRKVRGWCAVVALAAAVGACETARNPGGVQRDQIPPSISLISAGDTQQIASGLQFTVDASDNLGLKDIRLTYAGGFIAQTDTIFNTTVTGFNQATTVSFPAGSGAGGFITIIGRATDGAGNFAEDTIVIFLSNVQALKVVLLAPGTGALAATGKRITVSVSAAQLGGIQRIGFLVVPRSAVVDSTPLPINTADSVVYTSGFPDSVVYTDTLTVLATTGTFTVTGFAVDVGGRRALSSAVVVTVQSPANDVTPPVVSHIIAARVEVNDSITVHATDPSGISLIGFQVDTSLTLTGPPLTLFTVNVSAGNLTDVTRTMSLGLAALISQFPKSVIVRGYACDLAQPTSNCGYSQNSTIITAPRRFSGPPRATTPSGGVDTVVVVAGRTFALPLGGKIADAIFNANPGRSELYLTNPTRHRVEIFRLVTPDSGVFDPAITFGVGVPWGIALWPHDTSGAYGDSIVVADAGGTQLAIVDVAARLLRWRQDLPNFLIETYKILTSTGGGRIEEIIVHDVSDRPQYVATVCHPAGGTACPADSVYALYSTTPTVSSTSPFAGKATLRMERLVSPTSATPLFSHLFWELAQTAANTGTDTLRIELIRGNASTIVLSACRGVSVNLNEFGLGDSTYARNSGNFAHGFFGEGGTITTQFARVMRYNVSDPILGVGTVNVCDTVPGGPRTSLANGEDHVATGMSPGFHVSDFISNTGIHVSSIATNFNGRTNVVRADSIYYLDALLRLKATSCTLASDLSTCLSGAPGMDMNYFHDFSPSGSCTPNCGGGTDRNNRFLFAARPDASIDVFDTFDGSQFLSAGAPFSIPIRDPIVGPFRVARDATGTNQFLFGITASGLVMVRLPTLTNPNPAPPRR